MKRFGIGGLLSVAIVAAGLVSVVGFGQDAGAISCGGYWHATKKTNAGKVCVSMSKPRVKAITKGKKHIIWNETFKADDYAGGPRCVGIVREFLYNKKYTSHNLGTYETVRACSGGVSTNKKAVFDEYCYKLPAIVRYYIVGSGLTRQWFESKVISCNS